jgi:acyl-CoA thioesterase I
LIGVNNQYQNKPFALYENEFIDLLDKSIVFAANDKDHVLVVSIPDYAFTPFGQGRSPDVITSELNSYNRYAKQICDERNITFINITDITRNGLADPALVATDDLHPSAKAYTLFVERIIKKVKLN